MKTNKSDPSTEITPSKKKLTQARLPFKLISEDASTPATPKTRKRKLSEPEADTVVKVGKISKENDLVEDLVIISDEECKDEKKPEKVQKHLNPFVKLVDNARKKKLQKSKKRKSKKSQSEEVNSSIDSGTIPANDKDKPDVEVMDVDTENEEPTDTVTDNVNANSHTKNEKDMTDMKTSNENEILTLEDSNSSVKSVENNITETDSKTTQKKGSRNTEQGTEITVPKPVTPRTPRKAKTEANDKLNTSSTINKLNESVSSNSVTPKHSRSSSVTNSLGNESLNGSSSTPSNLTPKQLQKKLESARKREEREKKKQEREKKRQEEKEERNRQKQEKEDAKKKEREEKEEQRRKEKEEKERQKELEKKQREEKEELKKKEKEEKEEQRKREKEEKEEQRKKEKEAKEEEKRKKQEALELEKQEQELKKKKAAEAFVNFFVPKQKDKDQHTAGTVSKNNVLSSFTIKVDMRLAPMVRVELSNSRKEAMDDLLKEQKTKDNDLYLKSLKKADVQIGVSGKTWPLSDKDDDDDVMVIEDELPPTEGVDEAVTCEAATREKLRPKLLSFHENKRPPYWGTWRKKSAFVTPRRPFGQEKLLDYSVDSDEEWEEEEGESLDGSVADDEEPEDDYEVDNEVFVPHGYLSDEEATMDDDDDVLSCSPETQKARLKHLEDEFESEMKKPTEKLKPRLYGLLWETKDGGKPEKCVDALWNYFGKLSMIMDDSKLVLQPPNEQQDIEKKKIKKKKVAAEGEQSSPKVEKKRKSKSESKEAKKPKPEVKQPEIKKNQPGINSFLTKLKS